MFAKLHILHCGQVKVDQRLAFKTAELMDVPLVGSRSEQDQLLLPVSCYLIEHPKGAILIDAGWSEAVRSDPETAIGSYAYQICHPHLPPGQSIREQLEARNIPVQQLRYVLISHMDVDHISGLHHLEGAQSFIVSEPEWNGAKAHQKAKCQGVAIHPFSLDPIPFGPLQLGKDLYGDGSIYFILTPGHTDGLISVLVRVQDGWVLLVSDAGYSEISWNEMVLPGYTSDDEMAFQSLQWIREFSHREDCIAVIANHDPLVKAASF
ncbi:N-acyl homoserine lactonase family protein [Brevibacillus migulae]|uniref:N-acyl homoserine lactonase family protein n=1 Tax=Brevibacillus migulae TaxID=1644114 RepID=UPI001F311380|nr:N-acyl homoserine lactonase family protein [Brevibacillus migulae]